MVGRIDTQRVADILLSCWVIAHGSSEPFPMGDGILDIALKRAIERGAFPDFSSLTFAETSLGYRSPNLPNVAHQAQMSGLTASPNPYYRTVTIRLSKERALMIVDELGIKEDDARAWGTILKEEISKVEIP
jgi:hypothetical protein